MSKPTGRPNGRPPLWGTPEALEADVDKYIEYIIKDNNVLANKTGFAVFVGCDRATVDDYLENKGTEFSRAIKKLIMFSEEQCISKCFSSTTQVAGTIFLLKNLHKYTDKQELDLNAKGELHITGDQVNKLRVDDEALDAVQRILDGKENLEPSTDTPSGD